MKTVKSSSKTVKNNKDINGKRFKIKIYILDPANNKYKDMVIFSDYNILFNLHNSMKKYQESSENNIKNIIKSNLINLNKTKEEIP